MILKNLQLKLAKASLRRTVLVSASAVCVILVLVIGLVLSQVFEYALEAGVQERLQAHSYSLMAQAELDANQLYLPEQMPEPRFNQLTSGLYGFVFNHERKPVWRSSSALSQKLIFDQQLSQGESFFTTVTLQSVEVFLFAYAIAWESGSDQDFSFTFVIVEDKAAFLKQVSAFRSRLLFSLAFIGVVLLYIQAWLLKWGLQPLSSLARDIREIELGKQAAIVGHYPKELSSLVGNLNMMVAQERAQRERYRNTLADLAHSLKTPLTVLKNLQVELFTGFDQRKTETEKTYEQQIDRMDQIIQYQLKRSVVQKKSAATGMSVAFPILKQIIEALKKVYRDKGIIVEMNVSDTFKMPMDCDDLFELMGNLLDNAFKHAKKRIKLVGQAVQSQGLKSRQWQFYIEDDGPGIDVVHIQRVMKRGARLDTTLPGQGIGLAVVQEICDSYGVELTIDISKLLKGTKVSLIFSNELILDES